MDKEEKGSLPEIFFIARIGKESLLISRSAISKKKPQIIIGLKNIVNETGLSLRAGDKVIADLQPINETFHIIIKKIIARQQPVASSIKKYLKSLQVYIDDKSQCLDFQELNSILKGILGIIVHKVEATPTDHHLIIDLSGEDSGTKHCPFIPSLLSTSYPLKIDFPQASDETKKYLKMIYPNGKVTNARIFAFRLIHFLLHLLGYLEHFDLQKIEDYKRVRKALQEGNPSQIPILDVTNVCLCDWELIHFVAVQPNLTCHSFEKMLCRQCRKKPMLVGTGLKDFYQLFCGIEKHLKPLERFRTEKHIFYVIESQKDGLVFNLSPYKSKITVDITHKDCLQTILEAYEDLYNIFIPNKLFAKKVRIRRGDKVLLNIETATRIEEDEFIARAQSFQIAKIIKRNVKIIDPSSLLSRFIPFRLSVILKIGPETDLNFVKKVAKIVNHLTGWYVKIAKSSYEDLKNSFRMLTEVYEGWQKADPIVRSRLVAKVNEIINNLSPKIHEVEDSSKVIVYVFPERYAFVEDVFGNIAFGRALHRIFAVVSIFPSIPSEIRKQKPCKGCLEKPIDPPTDFREKITSLFVIHEVLHIASGLHDHRDCLSCFYNLKEMWPFRRYYCEECIRKGNDQTQRNCLMSYACLPCISTRLSQNTLSQFLCEKCKRKLLPVNQFAARQATRMNSLIYQYLLID